MRGLRCDGVIVRLTVLLRKAFVAMVNIDGNDGALKSAFDPKRTNTGTYTQINRPLSTGHSAQGRL
jgi:hypothetical protein